MAQRAPRRAPPRSAYDTRGGGGGAPPAHREYRQPTPRRPEPRRASLARASSSPHSLFVSCSRGLERPLAGELTHLGYQADIGFRGVYVRLAEQAALLPAVYRINYRSALATRVLLPLGTFDARGPHDLYDAVAAIDWRAYLTAQRTFCIDARVSDNRELRNGVYASQVTKDAIADQLTAKLGRRPNVDTHEPDLMLNLYIHRAEAVLSVDTSIVPLYRRGYKLNAVAAPLQESLAAAILDVAGVHEASVVCDPFCGSGTFLTEAALRIFNIPPGATRKRWGFKCLPGFDPKQWEALRAAEDALRRPLKRERIVGSDISASAVEAARANVRALGLESEIKLDVASVLQYRSPVQPTVIVCNPPYGERLGASSAALRELFKAFGAFLKKKANNKAEAAFVVTPQPDLVSATGLPAEEVGSYNNGGIDVRLMRLKLR